MACKKELRRCVCTHLNVTPYGNPGEMVKCPNYVVAPARKCSDCKKAA